MTCWKNREGKRTMISSFWAKVTESYATVGIMATAVLVCAVGFVACGSDPVDDSDTRIGVENDANWITTTDLNTGRTFDCYVVYQAANYENGGPAMWCYEP